MILFVFEGAEREPKIFKTLERLFFGEERIVCSFGNNIYELYRQLKEFDGDGDIVSILRENNAHLPQGIKSSDFSEIYLWLIAKHPWIFFSCVREMEVSLCDQRTYNHDNIRPSDQDTRRLSPLLPARRAA